MANLETLPTEIVHDIVSLLSQSFTDLLSCSTVCKSVGNVANSVLYAHIDLRIYERYVDGAEEKAERRQLRLLMSLAENPGLAAGVRTFINDESMYPGSIRDATWQQDTSVVVAAARNLKYLSRASFTANPLAAHVITSLSSYSRLTHLEICGLNPRNYIWNMALTSLKTLRWELWRSNEIPEHELNTVRFLENIIEATCPDLESLCIVHSQIHSYELDPPPTSPPERSQQYQEVELIRPSKLTKLRHFELYDTSWEGSQDELQREISAFVRRHRHTLRSISIPLESVSWTNETLYFLLEVCELLPGLEDLTLYPTRSSESDLGRTLTADNFFLELTSGLASPKHLIKRFSVGNIGSSFSAALGRLFSSWSNLRFLRVGDKDIASHGPYSDDDERFLPENYKPHILDFISELPQSLEELYIEINGPDLVLDEDEEFNPLCDLGPEIFTKLRRLHTCDIIAWIANMDGGLGARPEKAVLYRRLPHKGTGSGELTKTGNIKDIWTSRYDEVYQEADPIISKKCETVELEVYQGRFEGQDAAEVWLNGYTTKEQDLEADESWPFWKNQIEYPMFTKLD